MCLVALSVASLSLTAYFRPHRTLVLNAADIALQMTTTFVAAVGMAALALQEATTSDELLATAGTVSATLLLLPFPAMLLAALLSVASHKGLLPSNIWCGTRTPLDQNTSRDSMQLVLTPMAETTTTPVLQREMEVWC